jgi:hypothetical protein
LGDTPKRKNALKVKFVFEPQNPKEPQWAPKWANVSGVKFEFGSLPKRTNSPRIKFEFGFIKVVVGGLVVGPKNWQKRKKKIVLGVANSVL